MGARGDFNNRVQKSSSIGHRPLFLPFSIFGGSATIMMAGKRQTLLVDNQQQKQQNRLSRKLTVDVNSPHVNIRPVIKSKKKERRERLAWENGR